MYDLLLKDGFIVDAASGLDGVLDVAIENGKIARIAAGIAASEAARVIEVGGKLVTPGLIDCHAHVFEGVNRTGVNPDLAGVYAGVTTIVDAGSAGAASFGAFPRHIIPRCHLTVKRGTVFAPDFGPRPWGWEPDRVLPKGSTAGGCC